MLLDLHSTSAPGAPFCILTRRGRSEELTRHFDVPSLVGLGGTVPGTLIEHFAGRSHRHLLRGRRARPGRTIAHHEAALWILLAALDLLPADRIPALARHRERLGRAAGHLPRLVEVSYRHRLKVGETFHMLPGFENFAPVAADTLLARSDRGGGCEVRAPFDGLLVMPRYQGQGEDGFFLGNEVAGDAC